MGFQYTAYSGGYSQSSQYGPWVDEGNGARHRDIVYKKSKVPSGGVLHLAGASFRTPAWGSLSLEGGVRAGLGSDDT